MELRVIDACEIEIDGTRLGPESEILFAAALYLGVERGKRIERDAMAALLWPGAGAKRARHCLRQTLYKLRTAGARFASGASWLEMRAGGVSGDDLDLVGETTARVAPTPADGPDDAARRERVGEFLPGYAPVFSAPFAEWVERERDRVHANCRRALLGAVAMRRARGEWSEVERLARRCLLFDPLNEEATLALAEATALGGSKAEAVAILDRYLKEVGGRRAGGPASEDIRVPASVLRRRIAERLPDYRYTSAADACFVGRETSMALLHEHFSRARGAGAEGNGVFVWGPPGIGKTRLMQEFRKTIVLLGVSHARHGCQPSDVKRPLSVFMDIVPALLAMPGALGVAPGTLAHLKRLVERDPRTAPRESVMEAAYLFANVKQSLFDLLDAVAGEGCVVLLIENVHWLDPLSWELLREMVAWSAGAPIGAAPAAGDAATRDSGRRRDAPAPPSSARKPLMWVFTSRTSWATPEDDGHWVPALTRHELEPLDAEDAGRMLDELTAADRRLDAAHRDWCIAVADGNPLFLGELAVRFVQTGDVQSVPPSLTMLIEARLNKLGAAALRVLQACAVLGKNASVDRLEQVLGYRQHELIDAVEELGGVGLLRSDGLRLFPKHELVADAAVTRLSETGQRILEREAGMVLEREIRETPTASLLWDCAGHWHRAGEAQRALDLIKGCGVQLMEVGLPQDAEAVFEKALTYCSTPDQQLEILSGLSESLRARSRSEKLIGVQLRLLELRAALSGESDVHHEDELVLFESQWRCNEPIDGVLSRLERCVDSPHASGEHRVRAAMWYMIFAQNSALWDECVKLYERIEPLLQANTVDRRSQLLMQMVHHTSMGDLQVALEAARELEGSNINEKDAASRARDLRFASVVYREAGLAADMLRAGTRAFDIAQRHKLAGAAYAVADVTACALHDIGNFSEARRWFDRAKWSYESDSDDRMEQSDWQLLTAKFTLQEHGPRRALECLEFDPQSNARHPMIRHRVAAAAIWLRCLIDCGDETVYRHAVARLFIDEFDRTERAERQDTAAHTRFLLARQEFGAASALARLRYYVEHVRRGQWPLCADIVAALSS